MRKPVIDNVEIVEPPIGELSRKQNSLKRTCLTGCGCVVFLLIAALVGIRLFVGSGPETVKTLPGNFPSNIPVLEKDTVEEMTFISGKYKQRSIEIAAFFPKVILSPLLLKLRNEPIDGNSDGFIAANKNFWKLLTAPVGDQRDTVQIVWKNMDTEPSFMITYYKKELSKKGYRIEAISETKSPYQLTFANELGISGTIFAESDEANRTGTDYASLTVNIPPQYQNTSTP